jgi:hypothetical protein
MKDSGSTIIEMAVAWKDIVMETGTRASSRITNRTGRVFTPG